jgi:GrpB-like predicted nucleotidyltransferase (UPF0157 family)/GNAT superfamily N-acetyltransferase
VIGLKRGIVRLVPYSKEWATFFEKEKTILQRTLGNQVLGIQHVGSTSIPGMVAKPIIDIAVGIESIKDFKKCIEPLKTAGYESKEVNKNHNQFTFNKGPEEKRICHLHLVKYNGEIWKDYLAFRNYLKANKKRAIKYSTLKERLAKKYPENRVKYTKNKSNFIRETIKIARLHFGQDSLSGTVRLRKAKVDDNEFAFQTKKAAMKEYIDQSTGWDEKEQRRLHTGRFNTREFKVVQLSSIDVGITSIDREQDCIKVNQIYILPKYQNKGIGASVMKLIATEAAGLNVPVKLQVLKVNIRAKSFYDRLGFRSTGKSDTHFLMEKLP